VALAGLVLITLTGLEARAAGDCDVLRDAFPSLFGAADCCVLDAVQCDAGRVVDL
jgi:hypothetical protein